MRRRDFIAVVSGAAAWPLAARAQQSRIPVSGFCILGHPKISYPSWRHSAVRSLKTASSRVKTSQLNTDGLSGGMTKCPRWPQSWFVYPRLLVAGSEPAVLAAKAATSTIPIVFSTGTDPVKLGVVTSFNKPGGNATGVYIVTSSLEAKRLGLLHDMVPGAESIGVLLNPNFPAAQDQLGQLQSAARTLRLRLNVLRASTPATIAEAFESVVREHIPALIVAADPLFNAQRDQIVAFAAKYGVPAIYQFREYAAAGGLISYGIDLPDAYRQAGVYAGRILKGTEPNDLPVMEVTKFELVINLNTAKTLGIKISDNLMSLADEVIE
jgi:putative ABC transport system substrate-binding protein